MYEELFKLYCDKNFYCEPFEQLGRCCATNGQSMLFCYKDLVKTFKKSSTPNIRSVTNYSTHLPEEVIIDELAKSIKKLNPTAQKDELIDYCNIGLIQYSQFKLLHKLCKSIKAPLYKISGSDTENLVFKINEYYVIILNHKEQYVKHKTKENYLIPIYLLID